MLTHIFVKDLAIVSTLELALQQGMSALTGETGAGKSILIDALGLTLGDKTDNAMIRNGCDRAEISAEFDLSALPGVSAWLEEQGLDDAEQCILRRQLVRDSRSRAFVNGRPVPLQQVQELGGMLVDIHGQHAHQSLLRQGEQRRLLDEYAGAAARVERLGGLFRRYRDARQRLQTLITEARDRTSRLELLNFQRQELQALGLGEDELQALDEEQRRLRNVERLQETGGRLLQHLYEDGESVQSVLSRAVSDLDELLEYASDLQETRGLIEGAAIQVQEAASGLRDFVEGLELDPGRLQQVEQRLSEIHDTARKYRIEAERLPARLAEILGEIETLTQAEQTLEQIEAEVEALQEQYLLEAQDISRLRGEAGARLAETVSTSMHTLGMGGGRFTVELAPIDPDKATASGLDNVEFLVSANPGQPLRPLAKVASGGELSRISLAIQVATARCGHVPTLIFDEVDVGIGGGVAEIVGQLLRRLGSERQVLCVTHLPQVAAQAHHHLQVKKSAHRGQTHTGILSLSEEGRVEEVARMLGGVEITQRTRDHAREMLDTAAD